jgi:hypothetical protein
LSGSGSVSVSGSDSDSGGRSTKSRNSLFGHREAEDNEVELAILILTYHPCKTTKTEISKNSRLVSKCGSNFCLNESEWGKPVCQFTKALSGLSSCFNKKSRFFFKRTCLSKLKRFDRAQLYLFRVVSMSKRDQDMVYKELVNARVTRTTGYNLRMGKSKRNGFTLNVCRNSFVNVINISDERIKTINKTRLDPGPNVHRNTVNKNACHSKELRQSVVSFVKDKGETCGECYATRLIHHLTKYELRDEEKDAVDFQSNFTYRSLYTQYCYGRGWLVKADNKGRYPRLEDYNKRKKDDCLFEEEDMVTEEVVSWWSFRYIWKTDLPKICIRMLEWGFHSVISILLFSD